MRRLNFVILLLAPLTALVDGRTDELKQALDAIRQTAEQKQPNNYIRGVASAALAHFEQ